jgi:pyruvate dehydrogenase phosphatase
MDEVETWLVEEQSMHKGVPGSGIREWHSTRRPSNTPGEDELVNSRVHIPGFSGGAGEPWMFWGVFDGHG